MRGLAVTHHGGPPIKPRKRARALCLLTTASPASARAASTMSTRDRRAAPPPATRGTSPRRPPTISGSLGIALDRLGESDRVVIDAPHSSGTRRPGRCAASRAATAAAAAGGSQAIHTQRTVARISVEASAARVERARWRPDSRHLRQHMRRLAPHRGAHRPTSQRSPRRASTVAVSQPPSLAAHAPPRTTP